jgi:hypothetical protein
MNTQHHGRQPALGIDIGRVIINGPAHPSGGDTAFFAGDEATMLATPEMDDAFDVIARLVPLFERRVWLVSKCGPRVQGRTLRWLDGHDFYRRTGLDPRQVEFCRARPEKRGHCQRLELTHFIDDHPEVHAAIRGTVDYQYYFGPQARPVPPPGIHALTWRQLESHITRTLPSRSLADQPGCDSPDHGSPAGDN